LDLRILKDLAREIAELRILKDLGGSAVDGSQSRMGKEPENPHTHARRMRGTKVDGTYSCVALAGVRERLQVVLSPEHRGEHTHPRQFASLSKQRDYKVGSSEHAENTRVADGQKKRGNS